MSYKTILVHLNDTRRAEAVLEPAVRLATRHNSHLVGLHVQAAVPAPPIPLPYGQEVLRSVAAAQQKETDEIHAVFSRLTANQPFVAEWRVEKGQHMDPTEVVMEHSRAADLVVAGQTDPDREVTPLTDVAERLAIASGRPVLVIPYVGRYPEVGRNVVIAWKASREAARAVFDALPLLELAEQVQILEIQEGGGRRAAPAVDTTIAAALARHGIKPTIRISVVGDISIGDEILSRIADMGADLLVMGAYGHSRMRELVFGGATRHIARHMTAPVLFSH
jgi:nucleotide-binding universal stress UspA family protein